MTPKEKANEIANNFYEGSVFEKTKEQHILECNRSKIRALKLVDEIRSELSNFKHIFEVKDVLDYWQDVVYEIQKL